MPISDDTQKKLKSLQDRAQRLADEMGVSVSEAWGMVGAMQVMEIADRLDRQETAAEQEKSDGKHLDWGKFGLWLIKQGAKHLESIGFDILDKKK